MTGREGSFVSIMDVNPKYMLLGGTIGAVITYTVIMSMQRLGPARAVIFIVTLQLVAAYLIELLGLFGVEKVDFDWRRLIGIGIIAVGIAVFKW